MKVLKKSLQEKRTKAFENIYARIIYKGFSFPETTISSSSLFEFPVCFIIQPLFFAKRNLIINNWFSIKGIFV